MMSWKIIMLLVIVVNNVASVVNDEELKADYWKSAAQGKLKDKLSRKENVNVAKNVLIFIGDGMGISTITASRIYRGQQQGKTGEETMLSFEKFPHTALVKTYNVDHTVPDSAGTATAIFTGVKTNKAVLSVSASVKLNDCNATFGQEVDSVLQWAQQEGKSTGIITTTRLTDATPAALYCHSASRKWESNDLLPENASRCTDIAMQLIHNSPGKDINVILGGGRQHFLSANSIYKGATGQRTDKANLVKEWLDGKESEKQTAKYVTNQKELKNVDLAKTDYLFGLFAQNNMEYELDREESSMGQPSLAEMTQAALTILKRNPNGFFLMVEGARIDHGHHANQAAKALGDAVALNTAIETALNQVDTSESLVLVTADHSHVMTINGYPLRGTPILGIPSEMASDGMPYTTIMYTNGPGARNDTDQARKNLNLKETMNKEYQQLALIPNNDETHAGEDVALYAIGPMSHLFTGVIEQNYIAHAVGYAACVGENKDHCNMSPRVASGSFGVVTYPAA